MRIDPTGWAVGLTGCLADWFVSRQWPKIALGFLPLIIALTVGGLVAWGSWLDRDVLADRYLQLADAEVAAWEEQWAPAPPASGDAAADKNATATVPANSSQDDDATAKPSSTNSSPAQAAHPVDIPAFAEVLFRRVQQLHQNDQRSVFFVAMSYAQRGALQQALVMLSRIAPNDRNGYAPAHAWLAGYYLSRTPSSMEEVKIAKHHADAAMSWDRLSPDLLLGITKLNSDLGDAEGAVRALKKAAERDPKYNLALSKMIGGMRRPDSAPQLSGGLEYAKYKPQGEEALQKAEAYFREQLAQEPRSVDMRLMLADALLFKSDFASAEQVVLEGLKLEESDRLNTALSEIYRVKFIATSSYRDSSWSGDLELLDRAYRLDPNNPRVYEEVAKLARISGKAPNDELMEQLRKFLAEGKATSVTHAWISERYLIDKEMEKAIPHLEQTVKRDPSASRSWNNLAYCLAALYPERLEEALQFADKAVALGNAVPDFHDTRGTVLSKMGRHQDAIAAFERAIELVARAPRTSVAQPGYHERLAESYRAIGQEEMATTHVTLAAQIAERNREAVAKAAQSESKVSSPASSAAPDTEPAPNQAADATDNFSKATNESEATNNPQTTDDQQATDNPGTSAEPGVSPNATNASGGVEPAAEPSADTTSDKTSQQVPGDKDETSQLSLP